MNKFDLKLKIKVLEEKSEALRGTLGVALSEAQLAREELADLGKPVLSESMVDDLVGMLESVFADTIGNIDTSDLSPEFSLNYNEISLDEIDLGNVGVDTDELHTVFSEFFAIKADEDMDLQDELDKASENGDSRFRTDIVANSRLNQ